MIRKILFFVISGVMLMACSSDNKDDNESVDPIIGTWAMTGINVDEEANMGELQLASLAIKSLIADNCELLIFIFNADGTLVSTDKIQNLNVSIGSDGIVVPCPAESIVTNSTWSLEGDQLTITDAEGISETATINLENNTFSIAGEDIGDDIYAGADVVFTKQ